MYYFLIKFIKAGSGSGINHSGSATLIFLMLFLNFSLLDPYPGGKSVMKIHMNYYMDPDLGSGNSPSGSASLRKISVDPDPQPCSES